MIETRCFQAFLDNRHDRFTFVFGEAITIALGSEFGSAHPRAA
jgi:hypothetical protein